MDMTVDPTPLLEVLEAECLEAFNGADVTALDYALAESDDFNTCVYVVLVQIMAIGRAGLHSELLAGYAPMARKRLIEVVAQKVAPAWARREYERRRQEAEDMVAEWREVA